MSTKIQRLAALVVITYIAGHVLPGLWAPAFALVAGVVAFHIITKPSIDGM